jgi:hypothetical protein
LGEGVRDDFTFSGVVGAGTGVEEAAVDGDECIIEFRFGEAVAVGVDLLLISLELRIVYLNGFGVIDADMIWGNSNEFAICL